MSSFGFVAVIVFRVVGVPEATVAFVGAGIGSEYHGGEIAVVVLVFCVFFVQGDEVLPQPESGSAFDGVGRLLGRERNT